MSASNLAYTSSQPRSFLGECKRCGDSDPFIRPEGPHLGLFCRQCKLWQRWISKADAKRYQHDQSHKPAYKEVGESIGPNVSAGTNDIAARIEALERKFDGYDVALTILTKAVLSAGVLQPKGKAPELQLDDERIAQLGRELIE